MTNPNKIFPVCLVLVLIFSVILGIHGWGFYHFPDMFIRIIGIVDMATVVLLVYTSTKLQKK